MAHHQREVDRVILPANDRSGCADDQPPEQGTGPTIHRRYRIGVRNASCTADGAMARIQAEPDVLTDSRFAPFTKSVGPTGSMSVGDRFVIQVFGPWKGAVEVIDVTPRSFRLSTLEGHMESGVIEMRAHDENGELWFTIESWARSHDRFLRVLYDRLKVAYALQSEMWATALDRFAELAGGDPVGPIEILTERAARSSRAGASPSEY